MRSGGRVLVELYPGGRFHLRRNYPFSNIATVYIRLRSQSHDLGARFYLSLPGESVDFS